MSRLREKLNEKNKDTVSNELVDAFYGVSDNMSKLITELKKAGMTKELKHVMEARKHIDMTKLGNVL